MPPRSKTLSELKKLAIRFETESGILQDDEEVVLKKCSFSLKDKTLSCDVIEIVDRETREVIESIESATWTFDQLGFKST